MKRYNHDHVWITTFLRSSNPRQAIQECAVPDCGAARKFTWTKTEGIWDKLKNKEEWEVVE